MRDESTQAQEREPHWPGMVALVRNGAGEPTGGIHRTYLLDDGSGKAPPGKKMLGTVAGGCVVVVDGATSGTDVLTSGGGVGWRGSTVRCWSSAVPDDTGVGSKVTHCFGPRKASTQA